MRTHRLYFPNGFEKTMEFTKTVLTLEAEAKEYPIIDFPTM
jgi:hypothetical protein